MSVLDLLLVLLGQGVVVSWLTDLLKRLDVVKEHPKFVAGALNLLLILIHVYGPGFGLPGNIQTVLLSFVTTLMTSIGAHELKDATLRWLGISRG